jgi:hypothetical protein
VNVNVNVPWTWFSNRFRPFILCSMIVSYRSPFLTVTMTVPDRYHDRSWPFLAVSKTPRNGQERSGMVMVTVRNGQERSGTVNGQERSGTVNDQERLGTFVPKQSNALERTFTFTFQKRKNYCNVLSGFSQKFLKFRTKRFFQFFQKTSKSSKKAKNSYFFNSLIFKYFWIKNTLNSEKIRFFDYWWCSIRKKKFFCTLDLILPNKSWFWIKIYKFKKSWFKKKIIAFFIPRSFLAQTDLRRKSFF